MVRARLSSACFPTNLLCTMKSAEDIESYLLRVGIGYETIKPCIWVVKLDGASLVVSIAGPVVAFRLKVMDLPASGREELYKTLPPRNHTRMARAAFVLTGGTAAV